MPDSQIVKHRAAVVWSAITLAITMAIALVAWLARQRRTS